MGDLKLETVKTGLVVVSQSSHGSQQCCCCCSWDPAGHFIKKKEKQNVFCFCFF